MKWEAEFEDTRIHMLMGVQREFSLSLLHLNESDLIQSNSVISVGNSNPNVVKISKVIPLHEVQNGSWKGNSTVTPIRLGISSVSVEILRTNKSWEQSSNSIKIAIERNRVEVDVGIFNILFFSKRFAYIFCGILFTCAGIALDLNEVKAVLRNPIGISIAILLNFLLPLVSFNLFSH